jgi:hypothetical protein
LPLREASSSEEAAELNWLLHALPAAITLNRKYTDPDGER